MIDFVLKNAGVPAGGLDELGLGACVEILHADGTGAGHDGGKTGEAEAAFVEISLFVAFLGDHWIDDDMKWDGAPLAFAEVFGGERFQQIFAVFDHGELQRHADSRRASAERKVQAAWWRAIFMRAGRAVAGCDSRMDAALESSLTKQS